MNFFSELKSIFPELLTFFEQISQANPGNLQVNQIVESLILKTSGRIEFYSDYFSSLQTVLLGELEEKQLVEFILDSFRKITQKIANKIRKKKEIGELKEFYKTVDKYSKNAILRNTFDEFRVLELLCEVEILRNSALKPADLLLFADALFILDKTKKNYLQIIYQFSLLSLVLIDLPDSSGSFISFF